MLHAIGGGGMNQVEQDVLGHGMTGEPGAQIELAEIEHALADRNLDQGRVLESRAALEQALPAAGGFR